MVNMSAKFDKEIHNDLVSMTMFTSFFPSAKFDKEIHNDLVSMIMFTSFFPYMSIVTLTFDIKNQ